MNNDNDPLFTDDSNSKSFYPVQSDQESVVFKFGGSSVTEFISIQNIIQVTREEIKQQHTLSIVVSAITGVTDLLIHLWKQRNNISQSDISLIKQKLSKKHISIMRQFFYPSESELNNDTQKENYSKLFEKALLKISSQINFSFQILYIKSLPQNKASDYSTFIALGEHLSSIMISTILNFNGISAVPVSSPRFIRKGPSGKYQINTDFLHHIFNQGLIPVITGYCVSDINGRIVLLGRGGSDLSATLIGCALSSKKVVIYTDVSGVFTADPRDISGAFPIKELCMEEASTMAKLGAKVLHPQALDPLLGTDILLLIQNTFSPKDQGTLITNKHISSDDGLCCEEFVNLKSSESDNTSFKITALTKSTLEQVTNTLKSQIPVEYCDFSQNDDITLVSMISDHFISNSDQVPEVAEFFQHSDHEIIGKPFIIDNHAISVIAPKDCANALLEDLFFLFFDTHPQILVPNDAILVQGAQVCTCY